MANPEIQPHHMDLAGTMPLTRHSFAEHFQQMQRSEMPVRLEALRPAYDDQVRQYALAFAWAEEQGKLPDLVRAINSVTTSSEFLEVASHIRINVGQHGLQALINPLNPTQQTGIFAQHLPRYAGQVCRVLVDGAPRGTGFLVAPRVVATACHVLDDLIAKTPAQADWTGQEDSYNRLQFEFGHTTIEVNGVLNRHEPQIVLASPDWFITASECHADERNGQTPHPVDLLDNHHDYILCRLASIVGVDLSGIAVEKQEQLGPVVDHITIMQHPKGRPMRHQREATLQVAGTPYRVEHRVNTDDGSSGAPCFSDRLKVVAMHQAGPANGPDVQAGPASNRRNRCVPISWMLDALDALEDQDAGLMPIAKLHDGHPVFGRSSLLKWLHSTLSNSETNPILTVQTEGLPGRRFTVRIMRTLLPPQRHKVLYFGMSEFEGFDQTDAISLLYQKAGVEEGPADPVGNENALTARPAQQRYHDVDSFLNRINGDAGMNLWIVIDGYDRDVLDMTPGGTRDLFDHLFQRASRENRLRFVLLQRDGNIQLPYSVASTEYEILTVPNKDEMETYLRVSGVHLGDSAEARNLILNAFHKMIHDFLPRNRQFYTMFRQYLSEGHG